MSQEGKVNYRINIYWGALILLLALFLDVSEFALDFAGTALGGVGVVIGYLIDAGKLFILPTVFMFFKAPFWKGKKAKKKMTTMITSFTVGLIPWIGAFLPETLIGTLATILFTRSEDRGNKSETEISKNITRFKRVRNKIR